MLADNIYIKLYINGVITKDEAIKHITETDTIIKEDSKGNKFFLIDDILSLFNIKNDEGERLLSREDVMELSRGSVPWRYKEMIKIGKDE